MCCKYMQKNAFLGWTEACRCFSGFFEEHSSPDFVSAGPIETCAPCLAGAHRRDTFSCVFLGFHLVTPSSPDQTVGFWCFHQLVWVFCRPLGVRMDCVFKLSGIFLDTLLAMTLNFHTQAYPLYHSAHFERVPFMNHGAWVILDSLSCFRSSCLYHNAHYHAWFIHVHHVCNHTELLKHKSSVFLAS